MAGGGGNIAAQLPGGWESMRQTIREAQTTQPIFSSAPMVIQETLLFPYINGADFVRRFKARDTGKLPVRQPAGVDRAAHARLARTSASRRTCRATSRFRTIPGTVDENDFGEFGTRLFIFAHTQRSGRVDPRVERLGRRPLRAGEDAGAATRSSGSRCGTRPATRPSSCRRSMQVMRSAVQRASRASPASAATSRRRQAHDRHRRARDRRPPRRALRRRTRGLEHRTSSTSPRSRSRRGDAPSHASSPAPHRRRRRARSARDADPARRGDAPGAARLDEAPRDAAARRRDDALRRHARARVALATGSASCARRWKRRWSAASPTGSRSPRSSAIRSAFRFRTPRSCRRRRIASAARSARSCSATSCRAT